MAAFYPNRKLQVVKPRLGHKKNGRTGFFENAALCPSACGGSSFVCRGET